MKPFFKPDKHKHKLKQRLFTFIYAIFIITITTLAVTEAHAQTENFLTIDQLEAAAYEPEAEWSLKILGGVFGEDIVKNPLAAAGPPTTLIGGLVFIFNAIIFAIGVPFTIFIIVIMITKSAASGTAMGQNGENTFFPIRLGAGIGGMMPVFGGFSLAQAAMIFTITLGVGGANLVKNEALQRMNNMQSILPSVSQLDGSNAVASTSKLEEVGKHLFLLNLCARAHNYEQVHGLNLNRSLFSPQREIKVQRIQRDKQQTMFFGSDCGAVSITTKNPARQDDDLLAFRSGGVNYEHIIQHVYDTAISSLNSLQEKTDSLAEEVITHFDENERDQLSAFFKYQEETQDRLHELIIETQREHEQTLKDNRNELNAINETLTDNIKADGWTRVGAWFSVFSEAGAAVNDALNAFTFDTRKGRFIEQSTRESSKNSPSFTTRLLYQYQLNAPHYDQNQNQSQSRKIEQSWCPEFAENETGNCSLGQSIVRGVIGAAAENSGGAGLVNPIYVAKQLGDFMMTGGQAALAAGKIAPLLAANPAMAIAAAGLNSSLVTTIAAAAIGIGTFMSIYIPLLPTIIWISAIVVWIIQCIEAVLMSQISAFAHLREQSNGLVDGPAVKYYKYLLTMLLKPMLITIGFFVGSALLAYSGTFATEIFYSAMSSIQGNSTTGALSIAAFILIYFVIVIGLVQFIFTQTLIEVPNRILGWIGESDTSSGFIIGATAGAAIQSMRVGGGGGGGGGAVSRAFSPASPRMPSTSGGGSSGGGTSAPLTRDDPPAAAPTFNFAAGSAELARTAAATAAPVKPMFAKSGGSGGGGGFKKGSM